MIHSVSRNENDPWWISDEDLTYSFTIGDRYAAMRVVSQCYHLPTEEFYIGTNINRICISGT